MRVSETCVCAIFTISVYLVHAVSGNIVREGGGGVTHVAGSPSSSCALSSPSGAPTILFATVLGGRIGHHVEFRRRRRQRARMQLKNVCRSSVAGTTLVGSRNELMKIHVEGLLLWPLAYSDWLCFLPGRGILGRAIARKLEVFVGVRSAVTVGGIFTKWDPGSLSVLPSLFGLFLLT